MISMAEKTRDNRRWTPKEALEMALEDIESKEETPTSCLILFLDQRGNSYDISRVVANLSNSEAIALIEIVKGQLISEFIDV